MAIDITVLILILTNVFSFGANILQYCYKSKCSTINICCGLLHIERDIEREEEIDIESGQSNEIQLGNIYGNKHPKYYNEKPIKFQTNPTFNNNHKNRRRSKSF